MKRETTQGIEFPNQKSIRILRGEGKLHVIIVIIKSRIWHGFPRRPYHPSLPAGTPDNTLCLYKAVAGIFFLVVQHWHVRVTGSIGERI